MSPTPNDERGPAKGTDRAPEERPDTDPDASADLPAAADEDAFRANATVDERVARQPGRGREATTPLAIPPKGWWDIVRRVAAKVVAQNASILAAGVSFYAMLALFPALGAIVATYALIADPGDVAENFSGLSDFLPPDVANIIDDQLMTLADNQQTLGFRLVIGILFAIWSARRGVDALVRAVTVAYDERETRGHHPHERADLRADARRGDAAGHDDRAARRAAGDPRVAAPAVDAGSPCRSNGADG